MKLIKTVRKVKKSDAVSTPEQRDAKLKQALKLIKQAHYDFIVPVYHELMEVERRDVAIKVKNIPAARAVTEEAKNMIDTIKNMDTIISGKY